MEMSEHKVKMIETIAEVSPRILRKYYKEDCCIVATRIIIEVLKKLHFKNVKAFVVEANIFNEAYLTKGRTPQNEEEAQEWLKEGAWQIVLGDRVEKIKGKWPGHLVTLIDGMYIFDIALWQACRPHKNIVLDPLLTKVPEDFVTGEDKCQLLYNKCLLVYQAYPNDNTYQSSKDWHDRSRSKDVVREIYSEVKSLL